MGKRVAEELRALETSALYQRLDEAGRELMDIRFRLATRQTDNSAALSLAKRQIARIKTVLTERELEG
jgi:large subunit ribosomal protein L29